MVPEPCEGKGVRQSHSESAIVEEHGENVQRSVLLQGEEPLHLCVVYQ